MLVKTAIHQMRRFNGIRFNSHKDVIPKESTHKYDMILADLNDIKAKQQTIMILIIPICTYTIGTCIGVLLQ